MEVLPFRSLLTTNETLFCCKVAVISIKSLSSGKVSQTLQHTGLTKHALQELEALNLVCGNALSSSDPNPTHEIPMQAVYIRQER